MVTHDDTEPARAEPEELNLRVLQPLFRYVRHHHSEDTLHRIVQEAGLDAGVLRRSAPWVSLDSFEALLSGMRELVGSDSAFMRACTFDLKKVYGPMLLVIRSMTVTTGYRAMARTSHLVSRVSHYEVVESNRNSVVLRYHSKRPDSRLNCLSREAQLGSIPSLWWGIPPARVRVNKRIADGDEYCEYSVAWREPLKLRYPIVGAAIGFGIGYAMGVLDPGLAPMAAILVALVGAGAGLVIQMRRMLLDYLGFAEETSYEVEQVVQAHARAVDEVLALHQREREWSHNIENRYHERRERLEQVVDAIEGRDEVRDDKLLNLSHDMNNPLTVLLASVGYLRESSRLEHVDDVDSMDAISNAVARLQTLLTEMSGIVRGDADVALATSEVDIDDLTNRVRRQLRATVMSRDIRVTVFQTREAPRMVNTDATLLERVIDNLLTNACKYTHRGSIVVEVSGIPGYMQLKISDTGRGIGEDRLEQVFISGQPDLNPLQGTSHGDGLSIVVRILDQLAGRLEIMSNPGEGTTLWVSIPVQPTDGSGTDSRVGTDTPRSRFERVVKIRPRA